MQERGIRRKNGKLIDVKYIYFILHRKVYVGKVAHHGVICDNIYPQIITEELWNQVNDINEENKIAPSRKKEIFDYILTGKLICGECKHRMRGESATSQTGDIHYYYICGMQRRRLTKCSKKTIRKQYLEDLVVNATAKIVKDNESIHWIAQEMFQVHQQMTKDDTALKSLTKQRADALKASQNLIKAIEQGIITDQTKERLVELERQIQQLDFAIDKEKQKNHSYLTVEEIEKFLRSQVFSNTENIKIRKAIINMFVREVILYEDHILITYNFSDNPDTVKITPDYIREVEKQSEKAAYTFILSSCLCFATPPKEIAPIVGCYFFWQAKI